MPDPKRTQGGLAPEGDDQERDHAAKGGPATGLGIPDDKHGVPHPYDDDIQTQLAAKSKKKENKNEEQD